MMLVQSVESVKRDRSDATGEARPRRPPRPRRRRGSRTPHVRRTDERGARLSDRPPGAHLIVRAPYSRLSDASHTGTTLWASTSWNGTAPSAEATWGCGGCGGVG